MLGVKVEISRYVDDSFPGWVECLLIDAWGNKHVFIEKYPIVSSEMLNADSSYPQLGSIRCQILKREFVNGREIVKIDTKTPDYVESTTGETKFDVTPEQLIEF